MAKKELTPDQKQFIRDNRLKMSINKMCVLTDLGYSRLRGYMVESNLLLTDQENKNRVHTVVKEKDVPRKRKWVNNPWDYLWNTHTMAPVNNKGF